MRLVKNLEEALLNWADWHHACCDANEPLNAASLNCAIAVDSLYDLLHYREKNAIRGNYLQHVSPKNTRYPRGVKWTEAALHTAKQAIAQGLRERKLLSN